MAPTLQTLGQSLDHWQALYIISISLALLSTFAIVFFAFHKEHPLGLRTSNYIYVVASLLAVLATIVIVSKTKSLDAEKDRQTSIAKADSDLKIAQAQKDANKARLDAASAIANAVEAQEKAEEARTRAETIQGKAEEARKNSLQAERQATEAFIDKEKILKENLTLQQQVEQERSARIRLEQSLAPRNLNGIVQQSLIYRLKSFPRSNVDFITYSGNAEADNLKGQIEYAFQQAGW